MTDLRRIILDELALTPAAELACLREVRAAVIAAQPAGRVSPHVVARAVGPPTRVVGIKFEAGAGGGGRIATAYRSDARFVGVAGSQAAALVLVLDELIHEVSGAGNKGLS